MSVTQSFTVIVDTLARPVINSIAAISGRANLMLSGPLGPDYTVLVSTNLGTWQIWMTTKAPPVPISLMDTNLPVADKKFYRIQLEP